MTKRRLYGTLGIASAALLFGGGLAAHSALAQGSSQTTSLVSMIASRFNLKQSDVQAVFDQYGQQRQAEHQQQIDQKLATAVANGTITSAQKDLIEAKQKEVQQRLAQIKAMPNQADRKAALQQLQTDLKDWATKNGLGQQWLGLVGGHRGHAMGNKPSATPPSSSK